MAYIGRTTDGFGVRQRFLFTPDAGATSVSGTDANGATLTFSDSVYMDVFLNGVLLKAGTDYNTNTANTIAGLTATVANDEVTVLVYDIFTTADMVSATSGGTFKGDVVVKTDDGGLLTLQTSDTSITDGDVLGALQFQAPDELDGTDSTTVSAAIVAEADSAFDAATNQTDLVFKLGSSSVATEKMRLTHEGDLELKVDGFDLLFGADGDVNLKHIEDTGLLLNSTRQLQFGDSGTYIHQSADGVLDLVSDTEIEINATTIDINGNVDVSGTSALAGDVTLSRAETDGTVRLSLSNTGSNGTSEYSEIRLSSTAGTAATSIFQHRNNYGLNLGTTTNNAIYLLQNNSTHTTFETDGDINIADGNLVVASGHGVDFSATAGTSASNATGGSELLDDYEEGTWTPTILGSSSHPSITTSVAAGKYTRVGNLVFIQWNMIVTNVASQGSGTAQVGGLPYSMVGNTYQGHIGIMYNDTHSNETQKGYIPNGSSYINLVPTGRTQTNLGIGTISTGYFGGGGSYVVV